MLESILKIQGVKALSKSDQKNVNGGRCGNCDPELACCYYCGGCFVTHSYCVAPGNCPHSNCSNCV